MGLSDRLEGLSVLTEAIGLVSIMETLTEDGPTVRTADLLHPIVRFIGPR